MRKVDFRVEHGIEIQANLVQEVAHLKLSAEKWEEYKNGPAFTGQVGDTTMICAGVLPIWKGRWEAWAAISSEVRKREMLWIHRNVLKFLDNVQSCEPEIYCRIETTARADQPEAQRWLELLGFRREGRLRCYDASGIDHIQYARFPCRLTPARQPR